MTMMMMMMMTMIMMMPQKIKIESMLGELRTYVKALDQQ